MADSVQWLSQSDCGICISTLHFREMCCIFSIQTLWTIQAYFSLCSSRAPLRLDMWSTGKTSCETQCHKDRVLKVIILAPRVTNLGTRSSAKSRAIKSTICEKTFYIWKNNGKTSYVPKASKQLCWWYITVMGIDLIWWYHERRCLFGYDSD